MDFLTYVKEHQQELIDTTKALLKIPSVLERFDKDSMMPFGEEIQKALEFVLTLGKTDGFIVKNIQNYAAHIEHGQGEDLLGVLCHLDVVPAGDGWTTPPFQPTIRDDKLYARGATDDKGPSMAAYFALKFLKDLDVTFHKRVRIIFGTDEETAWRGIKRYFEVEEMPTMGFAPDASFPLIYGEKGIWTFDVEGVFSDDGIISFKSGERYNVVPDYAECELQDDLEKAFTSFCSYHGFKGEVKNKKYIIHGKNAHAMQPHLGVNAAFILAKFLNEHYDNLYMQFIEAALSFDPFGEKLKIDFDDEEMKKFTMNPGIFVYNKDTVKIGINCRYPKNFALGEAIDKIKKKLRPFNLTYNEQGNIPVHYVDPNDPLIEHLMTAYQKVTNDMTSKPFTIGGGTYARALDKAVAFGPIMPGRKDVVHQANEYIHLDDLIESTAIYMEAIYTLTRE